MLGAPLEPTVADTDQDAIKWLRPRGSNQIGMSQFNERIVLQAAGCTAACRKRTWPD